MPRPAAAPSAAHNVLELLERHRRGSPEQPVLRWLPPEVKAAWLADRSTPLAHQGMTYGELARQVEATAAGLAELGLAAGDRAFLFIPMSPQLYVAMFAVQRLGAIAVFLDSWARRDQLAACAEQVAPRGFMGPEPAFQLTAAVPGLAAAEVRVVVGPHRASGYSAALQELVARGASQPVQPVAPDDTALITFTTGSSGPPKGADRTHRFLMAQHDALAACLPYEPAEVDLPVFPIFSLNNIASGITTVLPAIDLAQPAATDGELLVAQMEAAGATCCTLSPSLLRGVCAAAAARGKPVAGLRRAATGGAAISADDVAAFRGAAPSAELHILYGSTEVEPIAHLVARDMPAAGAAEGVCVGAVAPGLAYRFLRLERGAVELGTAGWSGREVAAGEPGELVVSGEHVCAGYYNNPEAFQRAKIVDAEGVVWHRTGDVCRQDAAGRLWVVGRVHNAIRRGGELLFPVEAEVVMKRLAGVENAAYLGLPDDGLGERAVAAFVASPAAVAEQEATAGAVREALERAGIPVDEVCRVESMPLDPRHHSKVEYERLRQTLLAG